MAGVAELLKARREIARSYDAVVSSGETEIALLTTQLHRIKSGDIRAITDVFRESYEKMQAEGNELRERINVVQLEINVSGWLCCDARVMELLLRR